MRIFLGTEALWEDCHHLHDPPHIRLGEAGVRIFHILHFATYIPASQA